MLIQKTRGNADVYQNKGVVGKAICKCMEIKDLQIDASGGAIHKCMKRKGGGKRVVDGGYSGIEQDRLVAPVGGKTES